jgi:hypothetical protein
MGFASGFQVGAQAVERGLKMREEDELKRGLAEAYRAPTSDFGYTSEDMTRMRQMQGAGEGAYNIEGVGAEGQVPTLRYTPTGLNLGSGDMPEAPTNFAPQQIQRYGDQAVAGQFSPAQLRGLQAQAAARAVGASGDYRGAALLQQQADEAEFNAKYRPLQLQSMEGQIASQAQQRDLTGVQLGAAKRVEATTVANQVAAQEMAELRTKGPITQETISALAKKHGADPTQLLNNELAQYNFTTASLEAESKTLNKQLSKAALGGIPSMNKFLADKFDPDKTDNITPEIVQTKAGFVVMYGGKQLNEYGAHKNLNELVSNVSGMISGDPLNTAKTLAQIRASNAVASANEGDASLTGLKGDKLKAEAAYYQNRGNLDKMGATQYFTGSDGNMYASTPVFGKQGLQFETTQVNPNNIKLQKPGVEGKDMKPGKVEEEGNKATIGGKLHIADGLGNWVPTDGSGKPVGILPSERTKALEKAGVPKNLIPQIPWNTNGTEVMFGGKAYDVKNPDDLKELKADYKRLGANTITVEEEQKKIPGRNTGLLSVGQPYDPYGMSMRPRMGATQAELDTFEADKQRRLRNQGIAQRQTDLYNQQQTGLE